VKPLILALDTTRGYGSIALCRGEDVLRAVEIHAPDGFAHVLYRHLAEFDLDEIDRFAAASGPGSFTGVRVGLACIKGLAEACGKPAVAISNLQALSVFGEAPLRAVVLDARRGEVYAAVYDASGRLMAPETVGPLERFLAEIPPGADVISGDVELSLPNVIRAPQFLAGAIGRLAFSAPPQDPAALDANYVRRSDAELFWREV
jgi:tRNA threonylcarbamoyladenosine biosynthesis protein TsaB